MVYIVSVILYIFILIIFMNSTYLYCNNKYVELAAANIKCLAYLPLITKAWNRIGYFVTDFCN